MGCLRCRLFLVSCGILRVDSSSCGLLFWRVLFESVSGNIFSGTSWVVLIGMVLYVIRLTIKVDVGVLR